MRENILVFGAGGALGNAISNELVHQNNCLFTAGSSSIDTSSQHIPLSYDYPFNDAPFDVLPVLDAVIWAQGLNCSDTVSNFQPSELQHVLNGNVLFIAASLQSLLASGKLAAGSRLVIVSSIWQLESRPGKFSYTVSKAALQGLVKSCALDLGKQGILINAVLPGVVDTPMTRTHLSEAQIHTITSQTALQSLPAPEDIAAAVSFLASPKNRAITGQFLTVDGGFIGLKHA